MPAYQVSMTLEVHDSTPSMALDTAKHILNAVPFAEMPGTWIAIGTADIIAVSAPAERRDAPESELSETWGAWQRYIKTGDEAFTANMRPDGMRELLRYLAHTTEPAEMERLRAIETAAWAFRRSWADPSDRSPWPARLSQFCESLDRPAP